MDNLDSSERALKKMKMDYPKQESRKQSVSKSPKTPKHSAKGRGSRQPRVKPSQGRPMSISAAGIHNGDVGIFVTSNMGQEQRCLREVADLLSEYIDDSADPQNVQTSRAEVKSDLEDDINAELAALRGTTTDQSSAPAKLSLVTLDIPCVSFVRFAVNSASGEAFDPVDIVHKLCSTAADQFYTGPRSRYIQRLTPVSRIRKTLNDGLESLCDEVLPKHFRLPSSPVDEEGDAGKESPAMGPVKFAIRPTIRNNDKIDRDQVIRLVADKIRDLGHSQHKVDLKHYDRLVLVDVYRNVVGMSVIGADYDSLKRYNLAEIHASHFKDKTGPEQGSGG